jgi:2-polyprenyl-3-methyl-5-hydroxy-6-metoxy-1,4-benzoquinol methylase
MCARPYVKVLEAGCGSVSRLNLGPNAYIVGIDKSEEQLKRNTVLQQHILGDIQTYELKASEYDMIICWNVLEHLQHPERALSNFAHALKKDGIIILAMPNVLSAVGFLTKLTPLWFHIFIHRHLFGKKLASTNGYGPFKTYMRLSTSLPAIVRFAYKHHLSVEYSNTYDPGFREALREKSVTIEIVFVLFCLCAKLLSMGKLDSNKV